MRLLSIEHYKMVHLQMEIWRVLLMNSAPNSNLLEISIDSVWIVCPAAIMIAIRQNVFASTIKTMLTKTNTEITMDLALKKQNNRCIIAYYQGNEILFLTKKKEMTQHFSLKKRWLIKGDWPSLFVFIWKVYEVKLINNICYIRRFVLFVKTVQPIFMRFCNELCKTFTDFFNVL